MESRKEIIICNTHEPISLDNVIINISHEKPILPDDVEARVKDNWAKFAAGRPKGSAVDNQVAYLVEYTYSDGKVTAEVFTAGFSYNQYLNRTDTEMRDSKEGLYEPLASWIIAECDQGRWNLFGNKKDFGDRKVSGFGSFTSQADITEHGVKNEIGVKRQIDAYHFINRVLKNEMKDMSSRILDIQNIGIDYFPIVGPKGYDLVCVVKLDGKPDELQKHFNACDQFSKELIPVKSTPEDLVNFLNHDIWEPTRSCAGGILNYIYSKFGETALEYARLKIKNPERIEVRKVRSPI